MIQGRWQHLETSVVFGDSFSELDLFAFADEGAQSRMLVQSDVVSGEAAVQRIAAALLLAEHDLCNKIFLIFHSVW